MRVRQIVLRGVVYTFYALAAFVACLYVLFPYDLLQQRLAERLAQHGIQLTMAPLQSGFPPQLHTKNVRVVMTQLDPTRPVFQAESFQVRPDWMLLFSGTVQVHIDVRLYSGRLNGTIQWLRAANGAAWEVKTQFADLDMTQYPFLRKEEKALVRGRLSGESAVTLAQDGRVQDSALNLKAQPMVLQGSQGWQLPLQRDIACDTLKGEIKTPAQQAGNLSLTCQGKDLTVEATGTVGWNASFAESHINLRWKVLSVEAYKQELDLLGTFIRKRPDSSGALSFRLLGPLRQPRLGA